MAVADGLDGELAHVGLERVELGLRGFERGVEGCLVAFVEGAEVDGLDRGIELLLALGLAVGIGGDEELGGHDFLAKDAWVGLAVWGSDEQPRAIDLRHEFAAAASNATGRQYAGRELVLLSGLGVLGESDWYLALAIGAGDHVAVCEYGDVDFLVAVNVEVEN